MATAIDIVITNGLSFIRNLKQEENLCKHTALNVAPRER